MRGSLARLRRCAPRIAIEPATPPLPHAPPALLVCQVAASLALHPVHEKQAGFGDVLLDRADGDAQLGSDFAILQAIEPMQQKNLPGAGPERFQRREHFFKTFSCRQNLRMQWLSVG